MFLYVLAILAIILLILLYRKVGKRKTVFYGFCATILFAGGIAYFMWPRTHAEPEPAMTEAERYELAQQQQVFAAWYAAYQKDLTELDRNWQWYHHILESFKAGNIDLQTVHMRLTQLELDNAQLKARMEAHVAPLELNGYCYDQVNELIRKTNAYMAAQHRTVTLTRAAAEPSKMQTDDHDEQSRLLQTVMLRESPVALFTAEETMNLREQLAPPEEKYAKIENQQ